MENGSHDVLVTSQAIAFGAHFSRQETYPARIVSVRNVLRIMPPHVSATSPTRETWLLPDVPAQKAR